MGGPFVAALRNMIGSVRSQRIALATVPSSLQRCLPVHFSELFILDNSFLVLQDLQKPADVALCLNLQSPMVLFCNN
jgi:hypothetical protein